MANISTSEKMKAIYDLVLSMYKSQLVLLTQVKIELSSYDIRKEVEDQYDNYGMGSRFHSGCIRESIQKRVSESQERVDKWEEILNYVVNTFIDIDNDNDGIDDFISRANKVSRDCTSL